MAGQSGDDLADGTWLVLRSQRADTEALRTWAEF